MIFAGRWSELACAAGEVLSRGNEQQVPPRTMDRESAGWRFSDDQPVWVGASEE